MATNKPRRRRRRRSPSPRGESSSSDVQLRNFIAKNRFTTLIIWSSILLLQPRRRESLSLGFINGWLQSQLRLWTISVYPPFETKVLRPHLFEVVGYRRISLWIWYLVQSVSQSKEPSTPNSSLNKAPRNAFLFPPTPPTPPPPLFLRRLVLP